MYSTRIRSKTIRKSDKPISTCLIDQMQCDENFFNKILRNSDEVKEILKSSEPWWLQGSSAQDVTRFLKKATDILQRTIKIVDLNGGEQVFKFESTTKVQAKPYHLCFVQYFGFVYYRCWLSITCKIVQNTLTTQMEPVLENKPDLNKTSSFTRISNFFRR